MTDIISLNIVGADPVVLNVDVPDTLALEVTEPAPQVVALEVTDGNVSLDIIEPDPVTLLVELPSSTVLQVVQPEVVTFDLVGEIGPAGPGVTAHPDLTHRNDADQHDADAITYDNSGSTLVSTDVQAAIDEIDAILILGTSGTHQHTQVGLAAVWDVVHNLGYRPNVNCVDNAGEPIFGCMHHVSNNELTITFSVAISGTANCS